MSEGITRYVPALRAYLATEGVSAPAVAGWESFAPHRPVVAVVADPATRDVWAATGGGVLRVGWGAAQHQRYGVGQGLAGPAACVCPDPSGRAVWAGHADGGLSWFNDGRWWDSTVLRDKPVRALAPADRGVWVVAGDAVYHVIDTDQRPIPFAPPHPLLADARAVVGHLGGVLVATARGVARLAAGGRPELLDRAACAAVLVTADGTAWAGTTAGLLRIDPDGTHLVPSPDGKAVTALAAGLGYLWAVVGGRAACFADDTWRAAGAATDVTGVRCLAPDAARSGVWLGTDDRLAFVYLYPAPGTAADPVRLDPAPGDEFPAAARCLIPGAAADEVLVGTADGLVRYGADGARERVGVPGDVFAAAGSWVIARPHGVAFVADDGLTFPTPQPAGVPLALAAAGGTVFVLTSRALWRHQPDGWQRVGPGWDRPPAHLARTADGALWLGTTRGVYRLEAPGRWVLEPGPASAEVTALVAVGDRVWAGSPDGLWAWHAGTWTADETAGPVRALAPAAGGGVWVATPDRVFRAGSGGERTSPGRRVTALLERDGVLWAATAAGVVRVRLDGGTS